MSEDVYVLKHEINDDALSELNYLDNFGSDRLFNAMKRCRTASLDKIEDWILAIESGKKIVNPMSPKEELKQYYDGMCFSIESRSGNPFYPKQLIECVVAIIAKEHPDVADWLKDNE